MRIVRIGLIITVAASAILVTGCATLAPQTTHGIRIRSNPTGAHVQYGHQSGNTPLVLHVPRDESASIEVTFGRNRKVIVLNRTPGSRSPLNLVRRLWSGFILNTKNGTPGEDEPQEVMVDFKKARLVRLTR